MCVRACVLDHTKITKEAKKKNRRDMESIILEGKNKVTCLSMGLGGMRKLCFWKAGNHGKLEL
jgi:hypothetical protein